MTDFDLNIDFRHAVMARIVQSLGLRVPVCAHQHHGVLLL